MGYYNQNKIFDAKRRMLLENRPEEIIRQKIVQFLSCSLQFPKDLLVVEKTLANLSTSGLSCPVNRRVDILCYGKKEEKVFPLLLIECKAHKITNKDQAQIEGYNHWIQAKFVALVSKNDVYTGFYDFETKSYKYHLGLHDYTTLLNA